MTRSLWLPRSFHPSTARRRRRSSPRRWWTRGGYRPWSTIVQPTDFFREKNGWCWEAILDLHRRGEAVNQITVAHDLVRAGKLEELGGATYLSQLIGDLPTSLVAEQCARLVKRDSTYRALIQVAGEIARMAFEGGPDEAELLSRSLSLLQAVHAGADTDAVRPGVEILANWFERLALPSRGIIPPWGKLQKFLPDLRNGKFYILAGYTSWGKTSMAIHLMRETVLAGRMVLLVSLEMDYEQVGTRMIASAVDVDSRRVERGSPALQEEEERKARAAVDRLAAASWWVDDRSRSVQDIELRAKAHQMRHGCELLVIDHLQEVGTTTPRLDATEKTSEVCERIRELAASLDVPVLLLSQLRRAPGEWTLSVPWPRPCTNGTPALTSAPAR